MIEDACSSTLTPTEMAEFIKNLKAVQVTVAKRVNLNDLETLCTA